MVAPARAQRLPPLPPAQKDDKPALSALVVKAQFVMVVSQREADFGKQRDIYDLKVVNDVESAIHKWGRYKLVYRKEDADLIISVRRAGASLGPASGGAPRRTPNGIGTEYASEGDDLAVYNGRTGTGGATLWRKGQKDGLAMPKMPLLRLFLEEVDAAAAKMP